MRKVDPAPQARSIDAHRALRCEQGSHRVEHYWIARAPVVAFPQGQPCDGESADASLSSVAANMAADCCQVGTFARATDAASERRRRCSVSTDHATQGGGKSGGISEATSNPAPCGIVSGMAPAVVPMTGRPCDSASA